METNGDAMPDMETQQKARGQGGRRNMAMASSVLSNSMPANDENNPQNYSPFKKVFTAFRAWLFAFTVALGITCFTAGQKPFNAEFGITNPLDEQFIAAFSLYIFGIVFAPYWTPHLIERVGRTIPYYVALILNALFNIGAGRSHSLAGVQVCRFFAGLFGGLTLVSLEGTFAELFTAEKTNSYYASQGIAGFLGASFGPLIGGYLVKDSNNWRWTQYFPACFAFGVLLLGLGMPETYNREIFRREAKRNGRTRREAIASQDPAQSGVTIEEALTVTVFRPVKLFFTQPNVMLTSAIMFFTWATTFQWFIAVPAALGPAPPKGPGFPIQRIGLAFLAGIIGTLFGAATVIIIEHIVIAVRGRGDSDKDQARAVEYRVIPAMVGIVLITAAFFWVGNTIKPSVKPVVPIIGTAFYIWGSSAITFSIIPYTFDLFQPAPTLGAITSQAVGRLLGAGFLPFVILIDITNLGPKWGLSTFGFISLAFWPVPLLLFFFGTGWRERSKYSMMGGMDM